MAALVYDMSAHANLGVFDKLGSYVRNYTSEARGDEAVKQIVELADEWIW